jgi:sec-independent protein translocase protein TatB
MLNVGPLELLVVLAVALIVVGPERLPDLARSVGRVLRQFREVQDEVRNMVSSGVDDDMRDAAAEFRKVTGSISRATDVKGGVRRAQQSLRDATAPPPKRPTTASLDDAEEAGGPPADRLVEDAAADPATPAPGLGPAESLEGVEPVDPARPVDPVQPEDDAEPETPPQP